MPRMNPGDFTVYEIIDSYFIFIHFPGVLIRTVNKNTFTLLDVQLPILFSENHNFYNNIAKLYKFNHFLRWFPTNNANDYLLAKKRILDSELNGAIVIDARYNSLTSSEFLNSCYEIYP